MSYILCIDTALKTATISLSKNGECIGIQTSVQQQEHASFLQPAIEKLLADTQANLSELSAVAVSNGPGSYTGLRVGLASAKGLCYALNIPLITLSTLRIMAEGLRQTVPNNGLEHANTLYCPMIDARRMEVYTALYSAEMEEILQPAAVIINESFLKDERLKHLIIAGGDGADKWMNTFFPSNAQKTEVPINAHAICSLAWNAFQRQHYANLAYSEPFYCKAFYTPAKK